MEILAALAASENLDIWESNNLECDVLVMGSVELVNIKKRHVLGSIAMGIAKGSNAHMCVVKNFS